MSNNDRSDDVFDQSLADHLEADHLESEKLSGPPPALDDAILAAAHRAVTAGPAAVDTPATDSSNAETALSPEDRPRQRRWVLPLSLAASLLLAVSVSTKLMDRPESAVLPESFSDISPAAEQNVMIQRSESVREPAPASGAAAGDIREQVAPAALDQSAPLELKAERSLMPRKRDSEALESRAFAAPDAVFEAEPEGDFSDRRVAEPAMAPAAPTGEARRPSNQELLRRWEERQKQSAASAAPPPRESVRKSRPVGGAETSNPDNPEFWLSEIRIRGEVGQIEQAAVLLDSFSKRFPDHEIPEDLQYLRDGGAAQP